METCTEEGDGEEEEESEFDRSCDLKNRSIHRTQDSPFLKWYVLFIYCASTFMQVVVWNTWSPIASSVLFAFPAWHASTIALLSNWGSITFILFIIPSCWVLNKKGIRTSFIIADLLCTIGSGIRCLPVTEEYFNVLVHFGAFLCAIGGVMLGPAIVRLSSLWFPPNQRTSATGIGTACSQLGMAASYLVGPWIVSEPPRFTRHCDPSDSSSFWAVTSVRQTIRLQLHQLMLICFLCEFVLFWLLWFTFPEKPCSPPSRSSCLSLKSNYCFLSSISSLVCKKDVTLLALSSAFCSGIAGPWLALLTIMFSHSGITQNETAKLGFWTVICSVMLGLSVSKVSDFCPRHLKTIIFVFIFFADIMFLWILLLTTNVIAFCKSYLIIAVMCGLSTVWSIPALFYEFGVELGYPIPEGIVAGYMMTLNNVVSCTVYILLYLFPAADVSWMNYALVLFGILSLMMLVSTGERYNRQFVDTDSN